MNENVVQIGVALVIVNLVAWGGFTMLQDEDTNEVPLERPPWQLVQPKLFIG